jgi:hypothetical protein
MVWLASTVSPRKIYPQTIKTASAGLYIHINAAQITAMPHTNHCNRSMKLPIALVLLMALLVACKKKHTIDTHITGRVINDETRAGMPDMRVKLVPAQGGQAGYYGDTLATTTTDKDGAFSFDIVL